MWADEKDDIIFGGICGTIRHSLLFLTQVISNRSHGINNY